MMCFVVHEHQFPREAGQALAASDLATQTVSEDSMCASGAGC